ncbi:alpha/beta hydrolase [Stenotrophomonas sp. TWI587]|uniref:alpha/beta fold hydrolase n=1 Tax=Stenotrophomonas sp. TWI587 TaxID=3136783 RepID=UPI00320B46E6
MSDLPVLIVLPGMDATGTLHDGFIDAMAARGMATSVIAYPHDRPLDYRQLLPFVQAALPRDVPFVLLGESFSGPLALAVAARAPGGLQGLILTTTFARAHWPVGRVLRPLLRWLPMRGMPSPALSWWLLGRWATPAMRDALQKALAQVDVTVLRARLRAVLEVDMRASAPDVAVPVLCLHASDDRLLPARAQREWSALLPRAQQHTVAGPHLLLQANPQAAADVIQRFVGRLG